MERERERARGRGREGPAKAGGECPICCVIVGRSGSFPPPEFIDWELLDNRVGRLLQLFHAQQ